MGSGLSSPSGSEPVATDSLSPHLSPVAPVKATLAGSPSPPRPPPAKPQLEGPTEAELFASGFTEDVIDCCFLSADDVRARLEVQRTKRVSIVAQRQDAREPLVEVRVVRRDEDAADARLVDLRGELLPDAVPEGVVA